jgi:hypothetical protein
MYIQLVGRNVALVDVKEFVLPNGKAVKRHRITRFLKKSELPWSSCRYQRADLVRPNEARVGQ